MAPLHIIGRFSEASNATLLVQVLDDASEAFTGDPNEAVHQLPPQQLAVYKPAAGEAPLWDFPSATLYRREVAAFVVSDWFGFDLVPVTVIRDDAPAGPGSLQQFVTHDPAQHYLTLRDHPDPAIQRQLVELITFDILVNNADRKAGHVLRSVAPPGKIFGVDHGVCFHVEPKLRTVAWDHAGEHLPVVLVEQLQAASGRIDELQSMLDGLLTSDEVAAFTKRLAALLEQPEFPHPTSHRPLPWPLI